MLTHNPQDDEPLDFIKVTSAEHFPHWAPRTEVVRFFHETMRPYEDSPQDISGALDYAFSSDAYAGGFLMLVRSQESLAGACLMLRTGMSGYVPEYFLVFVTVNPELRGQGIGQRLIQRCLDEVGTSVKLHVDFDNPAKRLYERMGFEHCYAEMRYKR